MPDGREVQFTFFKRLFTLLLFKKGLNAAVCCFTNIFFILAFLVTWVIMGVSYLGVADNGSIIAAVGLSFVFLPTCILLCIVLKIIVSSYFETSNSNAVVSYDNERNICTLTLEDIKHFEGIIASKDDTNVSELPGYDLYNISVPTKFLTDV